MSQELVEELRGWLNPMPHRPCLLSLPLLLLCPAQMEDLAKHCLAYIVGHLVEVCREPHDLTLLPPDTLHQLATVSRVLGVGSRV